MRDTGLGLLCLAIFGMLLMLAYGVRRAMTPPLPEGLVIQHVVTSDCVSSQQMAQVYGWQGDYREYEHSIAQINGWERWPRLRVGQQVRVLDYREAEDAR
jgi:hypothetical protein